jgi:hypothetical protein
MPTTSNRSVYLPEPKHPFARWFGGATIGIWALVVQSFVDPWNKIGAILSPGVGYILGHLLQAGINYCANMSSKRKRRADLANATHKIDDLYTQRNLARDNGAISDVLLLIDQAITAAEQEKLKIISPVSVTASRTSRK